MSSLNQLPSFREVAGGNRKILEDRRYPLTDKSLREGFRLEVERRSIRLSEIVFEVGWPSRSLLLIDSQTEKGEHLIGKGGLWTYCRLWTHWCLGV